MQTRRLSELVADIYDNHIPNRTPRVNFVDLGKKAKPSLLQADCHIDLLAPGKRGTNLTLLDRQRYSARVIR